VVYSLFARNLLKHEYGIERILYGSIRSGSTGSNSKDKFFAHIQNEGFGNNISLDVTMSNGIVCTDALTAIDVE
jgi:hypothetical protein